MREVNGQDMVREAEQKLRLRQAFGRFATGVSVVTASAPDAAPVGITVNSLCSVSLEPPLLLWCLRKASRAASVFCGSPYHAVHVLASGQEALSRRFASSVPDRFRGVPLRPSDFDVPVIEDCLARFIGCVEETHEFGDHFAYLLRVVEIEASRGSPLIFHDGKYHASADRCGLHPG